MRLPLIITLILIWVSVFLQCFHLITLGELIIIVILALVLQIELMRIE